ncbi:GGDEF domain-containing protein [Devosia enhydra]|uniref:GGDEF domain-containing protein n=1 Tax=Devosia enhydra TaxID=665118 RepID=UPI0009316908|nr:GGDEF domain-containing protein [Devosia enhydra]
MRIAQLEIKEAVKYQTNFAVLMVELDHFKSIKYTYGHGTGDAVLASLGRHLKSAIRESDYVGPYGGEEFCIILPGASPTLAFSTASRIRATIESARVEALAKTALH